MEITKDSSDSDILVEAIFGNPYAMRLFMHGKDCKALDSPHESIKGTIVNNFNKKDHEKNNSGSQQDYSKKIM